MKNYRFYFYTIISFSVFSVLVSVIGIPYLLQLNGSSFLENEIEASQQQARQIALMSASAFENRIEKDTIVLSIKEIIENTDKQNIFISIFDWSGEIVSHPDNTRVKEKATKESTTARNMENTITGEELYTYITSLNDSILAAKKSEIIYLTPVAKSDWIVAAHINISNINNELNEWKSQTYLVFLIIILLLLLIVLGVIRLISGHYENQLALKNIKFEDGVLNLSKLNTSLETYQNKLNEITTIKETDKEVSIEIPKESEKQRILTYVRNELMPISTEDIGYIYVENTITYIVKKDGKRSTTSESLDQIYSYLNEQSFFRANRQIIVAISAIDKITKFGNSKLKIQVNPPSEIDIVIGKNKAAAFKQWLDL